MEVMVFAPHPDDDLLGCGGSMAKAVKAGHHITIVYMSSGECGSVKYSTEDLRLIREEEARKASQLLGIRDLVFMRYPDGNLQYTNERVLEIVTLLRRFHPQTVYLPHQQDRHHDHTATHQIVMEACKRAAGPWFQSCTGEAWQVPRILAYEVWTPLNQPSYYEDISAEMEIKKQALQCHCSQLENIAYDEAISGLNRYRSVMSGIGRYAECFQILHDQC